MRGARRQGKRREVWIWTEAIEEPDGRRWVDFTAGDRSEAAFLRLYERLPEAERYRSGHYAVYEWLPRERQVVGRGGATFLRRYARLPEAELYRSEATFLRQYARLPEAELYRSDHYAVQEWLPRDRHLAKKGGAVNWNEELHSRLRDKLKQLQRRAEGYSKSLRMLVHSIAPAYWYARGWRCQFNTRTC